MADTIFMIHGMWGGPWCWENYRRKFEAEGYRCVVATLPYHDGDPGAQPHPRLGSTSLLEYADTLEHEVRRLGVKPILMGHSMGGLLAQMLAARGLARAVVLITPASPSGINAITPAVVRSFWSILTTWGFWRRPMRQTFGEAVYSMLHVLPEKDREVTYGRFAYESGRAAAEIGFWFLDPKGASRVDESNITCPMAVVGAGRDRMTPASVVRKVARKYHSVATYREFEDHSHWVLGGSRWEEVADHVSGWLRQLRTPS